MLSAARLRVLHEVARQGSLTAAASALNYTVSAVSQQISLLERESGTRLLDRHPRGVRLTEAGRVLARHAAAVDSELRAAQAALRAIGSGDGGRLRFGSFPTANAALMPAAVAAFRAVRPGVDLELAELDRDEGMAAVADHRLDIALVYEFPVVPLTVPAGVETVPLLVDPLHIMLPRDHPLAAASRVPLASLAGEDWIQGVHHGSTMAVLPQAGLAAGFEPRILFRTDDQMTVRGLVAAGLGVALASWLTLSSLPPGLVAVPLEEWSLTRTVLAALPPAERRLPAADAMVEALRAAGTAVEREF